jgi:hypothetical protein
LTTLNDVSVRLIEFTIVVVFFAPAVSAGDLRTQLYASGFVNPVAFVQDPTDRSRQFVVEQGGHIRVISNGAVMPGDFLNLSSVIVSGGERGLLGMAFAPDYAATGRFFVNFTRMLPDGVTLVTVLARFKRSADPFVADASSRFDLRWGSAVGQEYIVRPYANHNGGNLACGPDGYLYVGLGDGGSGDDPQNRAQDPTTFLGKMLRIDVNVPDGNLTGYQVPVPILSCRAYQPACSRRSGASVIGIPGAIRSTTRAEVEPARSSSAMSARANGKRSISSRRTPAAAITDGDIGKGRTITSRRRRPRFSARRSDPPIRSPGRRRRRLGNRRLRLPRPLAWS